MTLTLAVPLALLWAAQPAPPPKSVPPAQGSKLEQGVKAFNEGQFDAALKALDAAATETTDPVVLVRVQLLRGQCLAAKQDFGKAEEAFALALESNPEASLDPGKVDPAVVKLLESMRGRLQGSLTLRTTPPDGHVFVDGTDAGPAPATLSLSIGRHKVAAQWLGEDKTAPVEVLVRVKRETVIEFVRHEKLVEGPQGPVGPKAPSTRLVHPFAALRGALDVNAGPEGGIDVGGGIELPYVQVGVYVRPYRWFELEARIAAVWQIFPLVSAYLEVEATVRPISRRFGVALGGAIGGEYLVTDFLGAFLQVGAKYFFINDNFVIDSRVTFAGGLRLRLP